MNKIFRYQILCIIWHKICNCKAGYWNNGRQYTRGWPQMILRAMCEITFYNVSDTLKRGGSTLRECLAGG